MVHVAKELTFRPKNQDKLSKFQRKQENFTGTWEIFRRH